MTLGNPFSSIREENEGLRLYIHENSPFTMSSSRTLFHLSQCRLAIAESFTDIRDASEAEAAIHELCASGSFEMFLAALRGTSRESKFRCIGLCILGT